jgi:hypothetical protein
MKNEDEANAGGIELIPAASEADKENFDEKAQLKMESMIKDEKRPNL